MTVRLTRVSVALVLYVAVPLYGADLKKLKEADVLKLIELQIRDDAIVERIIKTGLAFQIDETMLDRFKRAGASDAVLAALRGTSAELKGKPADNASLSMMLWALQNYSWDCPLHSEIILNGESLGQFSSNANRSLGGRLKNGWNTIDVKTTVVGSEKNANHIVFSVGPVQKDPTSKKETMEPVLWQFDNGTDWKHKDGKYTHRLGPDMRTVTVSYNLYYAGPEHERTRIREGDYVLKCHQGYSWNTPISATIFVNKTQLTSFLGNGRSQLVITPLLHAGKNEIRIVTHRVKNLIENNDFSIQIGGPAEYSATESKFVMSPVINFKAITGWQQDKKTGQWLNESKPDSDTLERTLPFTLDKAPTVKD